MPRQTLRILCCVFDALSVALNWLIPVTLALDCAVLAYAKCGCDDLNEFLAVAGYLSTMNACSLGVVLVKKLTNPIDKQLDRDPGSNGEDYRNDFVRGRIR